MTITDSGATAPTSNIFESHEPATQTVTRISADELTDRDRGQSFTVGQIGVALDGEQYGLTAITLKLDSLLAGTTGDVTLTIVSWDGLVTSRAATKTQLYQQTGSFSASALDAGDYFTMNLGTTINLTEGANYAFLLSADSGSGLDFRPDVGQNANATHEGVIWSGGTTVTSNQDMVFYLQGTVIGGAPDTTPPVWEVDYPKADTATTDEFTIRAQIDEAGTANYVVLADGAGAPSAAQVIAGNDAGDSPATASGSIALAANTENTAAVTGLSDTTAYDVWFVAQDGEGTPNVQLTPVKVDVSTLAPDVTPPTWTATYPKADTPSEDGFTVRASIVGEAGTAYYVVLANGASAPTEAQIQLGNNAGDTPALKSGSLSLTADTENSQVVTGLAAATDFDVYVVAEDSVSNLTTPVAIDIATLPLDLTVPSWTSGYPLVDTVTSSGFTVRASIDEAGTAYYVVVADGASAPSAAQIKAGTDAGDVAALKSGNLILAANTENSTVVTGLADNTSYDIYIVVEDGALAKNTTAVEFREATTPVSTLTVGSGIQYNDNVAREVSVYPGNSYVRGFLGETAPGVEQTLSLGTVAEYRFFNGSGTYSSTGTRIGAASTDSTVSSISAATAVYTAADPNVGPADFTSNTNINGITSVSGSVDVTGLPSGTLYFIYGTNGTRNTSFVVSQGVSSVEIAGNAFWDNGDTICAATPVSFTNDGSNNTIAYSYTQTGAGKFMGVVLSTAGGGGYTDWANANVGGQPADGDFNFDGVDNGIAYFMDDTGVITPPGIVGGSITWINGGNIPSWDYGTQFKVQTSQDLSIWSDVGSTAMNTPPNVNNGTTLSYTLPTGQGRWFVRLVVTPN